MERIRLKSLLFFSLSALILLIGWIPVSGSQKAYVFSYEDVSIMAPLELASGNYGDDDYLVSGYLYREVKHCSGGPCLITLENDPAFILLKFKPSSALVWKPTRVELHLSALWLDYYLPSNDFSSLCRFSISLVDVDFSENEVTWKELKKGVPWDPEAHLKPLGTFFVSPYNSSHIVLDLTDQLKGLIGPGSEVRLAITPSPEWWNYGWEEGMGCSLYIRSSEGGAPPYLLLEKETEGQEQGSPLPPIKIPIPQSLPLIEIPESIDPGYDDEKIPLPDIPVEKIPKLQPKVIPPPNAPENPEAPEQPSQPEPEYPPTFSLHIDPPLLSVYPGEKAVFSVQVIPFFGFSAPVELQGTGGPQGSAIQVLPDTVNPAAAPKPETKVVVSVSDDAPPGNYLIQVKGTGGELENTVSAWLQVKPVKKSPQTFTQTQTKSTPISTGTLPSGGADFLLKLDHELYETYQGRAVTMWIEVLPIGGFDQPVDLSVTGVPPGSLFLIHNTPLTPGQKAALRILPGEETPTGSYDLVIVGSHEDKIRLAKATLKVKGPTEKGASSGEGGKGELKVGETLIKVSDSSLVARVGVPVRTVVTALSTAGETVSLEVRAPPEVIVKLNKTTLKQGESTYVYMTARSPGEYEVRIWARGTSSAATIKLKAVSSIPVRTGTSEAMTQTRTSPGIDLLWITALLLLIFLIALLLVLMRRRKISREGLGQYSTILFNFLAACTQAATCFLVGSLLTSFFFSLTFTSSS